MGSFGTFSRAVSRFGMGVLAGSLILSGQSLAEASSLATSMPAAASQTVTFGFDDFSSLDGLNLHGAAAAAAQPVDVEGHPSLRVLRSLGGESSSVFWDQPIQIGTPQGASSFSQKFQFRISENRNSGADGIVFVVGPSPDTVGGYGGGLGYLGIKNSIGVEFDTWGNGAPGDPNGNHVGINVGGSVDSIATGIPPASLENGNVWTGWVDYDGPSHRLEVRASDTGERPNQALVAATVDIPAEVGGNEGYFGLTAASGFASQTIDVLSWNGTGFFPGIEPPTPDPVPAPVADAGLDQVVDEGSTVTLDGSASKASTKPALQASEQRGALPGGTSLGAALDGLDEEATGIRVGGSVSLGQGPATQNTSIAYVVDVSGSAGFQGGPCGDVNGDRRANTILDCELAAALKLHEEVAASGTVDKVALITFSSGANAVDLDPTAAVRTLVSPEADADGNGVADIVQAIKRVTGSGGTNFLPPVTTSCKLLATTGSPNLVTAFMSDGQGSGSLKTVLPCNPPVTFHAFAVGSGSQCAPRTSVGSRLIDMATLSGGTCTNVPVVSDLPGILPKVISSRIIKASYTIDGGTPVDLSSSLGLPKDGPADLDVSFDLPADLRQGQHRICLTVTGQDSGGTSSETTCSDLVTVTGEVSYSWRPGSTEGPPVFLSSRTSARPTFLAPDDGRYVFELTVTDGTGSTATDEVVVEVSNLVPTLELTHGDSFAGGVTQVNATLTDGGWLDTHTAVVDWGDGTTTPVDVTTAGAGWGTFFGSQVYRRAGSFDIVVTLTDDDGGIAIQRLDQLEVTEPAAVWANSTASRSLNWAGGSGEIQGRVHTNGELRFVGATKTIKGASTYAGSISADTTRNSFTPLPVKSGVLGFPMNPQVADFRPGGPVAVEMGSAYHDMSALCSGGSWHDVQSSLASGVYYANCDIQLNGSQIDGRVTLVSEGRIKIAGSRPAFEPYLDGLLMLAGATGTKAIDISTSSSKFLGVLFAGSGEISVAGAGNRFYCGILGNTVAITGTDVTVRGADCGRPGNTVSGPVVVPDLAIDLAVDRERALPGDLLGYDVTVTNAGTTLVVPSLIGLENVDTSTARVVGHDFTVERQVAGTGAWVPVAGLGDPSMTVHVRANPFEGVQYAAGGAVVGTTLAPGGWATWGVQAELSLTPAQIAELLDPSRTTGVRTRVDFTLDPSTVQARRLYTYGTDFAPALRALGADAAEVAVTSILPDGDAEVIQITDPDARIAPGESVTRHREWTVPVPSARAVTETDAGYLSRLLSLDGTQLNGAAYAQATGGVGLLVAPLQRVTTTRELPVVGVSTVGSATIPAGSSADYEIKLANHGSAGASALETKATANATALSVTEAPTALDAGELATARTSYAAPAAGSGSVILRGTAAWQDARGNAYGLSGSDLAVERQLPATLSATLVDALVGDVAGDGAVSPGDTVRYTLTVANRGGVTLAGVSGRVPAPADATLVAGSGATPDGGTVSLAGGEATFTLPNIAGSATRRVVFDVVVAQPFPAGTARIETQGSVSATGLGTLATDDPALPGLADPTRTTVTRPTPALIASLGGRLVIDADGSGGVSAGDTLAYDLSVSSVGTQAVTGTRLDLPAPAGTSVVADSVRTSQGTITAGPGVGIDLGTLAPFQQANVDFRLRLGSPLPAGTTAIRAQGTVTSSELDPVTTDDPQTVEVGDITVMPIGGDGTNPEIPGAAVGVVSPAEGAIVTAPTRVTTTLSPPDGSTVASWRVDYQRVGEDGASLLGNGTGTDVDVMLDPTVLPNGAYELVIRAATSNGGMTTKRVTVVVDGDLKLGRYQVALTDMSVGVGGLPLHVTRAYDSFDKSVGDFGVGWTMNLSNFTVADNGPLGAGGWTMESCGGGLIFSKLCFKSTRPHFVAVTWPDGRNEIFDLRPAEGSTFVSGLTSAKFAGRTGTTSTLRVAGDDGLFLTNGNLNSGLFGSGPVFDPQRFVLTDKYGVEYRLDAQDGLTSIKDRLGNVTTFGRDGVRSSTGVAIDIVRDAQGRIVSVTGPDQSKVTYAYNAAGDLSTVTDQRGVASRLSYLTGHYLDRIDDPTGRAYVRYEYADGRLVAIIDGEGNRTQVSSDVGERQETITDASGRLTTVTSYDSDGRAIRMSENFDGSQRATEFVYDDADRIVQRSDSLGRIWKATYDAKGNLTSSVEPGGARTVTAYDGFGNPTTLTDPNGGITRFEYDSNGNLVKFIDAGAKATTYAHDAAGNMTSRTDALGHKQTWTYDSKGRVLSATDPLGNATKWEYDANGRKTAAVDAAGGRAIWSYDDAGRLRTSSDALGRTVEWRYDDRNQLVGYVDANGKERTFQYDGAGRVVSETDALGRSSLLAYDAMGRTTSVKSPTGATTRYAYDGAGRLETVIDPSGRRTEYATTTPPTGSSRRARRSAASPDRPTHPTTWSRLPSAPLESRQPTPTTRWAMCCRSTTGQARPR